MENDAYRIIPGETYVIESKARLTRARAEEIKARFEETTGAKCVVLDPSLRLVKAERPSARRS